MSRPNLRVATLATPRRQRVFEFRRFVLETFSCEWRTDQRDREQVVLDVAGGKGDLSWLLCNADHINAVIVDPRTSDHVKLERTAMWLYEHQEKDISNLGPQGPLLHLKLIPPYQRPHHLRVFFDECLIETLVLVRTSCVDTSLSFEGFWKEANHRADTLPSVGHHQPCTTSKDEDDSRITDPSKAYILLAKATLLLGFHPDQATDSIVDYALSTNTPFAIVPCCLFTKIFSQRRLKSGQKVRNYDEYIQFLLEKDKRIRISDLKFYKEVNDDGDGGDGDGDAKSRDGLINYEVNEDAGNVINVNNNNERKGKRGGMRNNIIVGPRSTVLYMLRSDFT